MLVLIYGMMDEASRMGYVEKEDDLSRTLLWCGRVRVRKTKDRGNFWITIQKNGRALPRGGFNFCVLLDQS